MIRILILTTILISCASKPSHEEESIPVVGMLKISEEWANCNSTSDCKFNYDRCGNYYVFNSLYSEKFSELSKNSNLVCHDLVKKPHVKNVECVKKKCKAIF